MYSVKFSETAEKQFFKLGKDMQRRVINVLERIKIRPFHFIKRKQGTPYYILRIGEYRAILNINLKEKLIFVMEIGHRKRIYK